MGVRTESVRNAVHIMHVSEFQRARVLDFTIYQ